MKRRPEVTETLVRRIARPPGRNTSAANLDVKLCRLRPVGAPRGHVVPFVTLTLDRLAPGAPVPVVGVRRAELLPLLGALEDAAREMGLPLPAREASPDAPAPAGSAN